MTVPFIEFLNVNPSIHDILFAWLSPGAIARYARTCRYARAAVLSYNRRAYNINRHLAHFLPDPHAFRALQARTGMVISGSNALQFLDRTHYPGADLDIYVDHMSAGEVGLFLLAAGYEFRRKERQVTMFQKTVPKPRVSETRIINSELDPGEYTMRGVTAVYNFVKVSPPGLMDLKIQLIVAHHTPLEIILNFHSTCVMNLISYNTAYSLYPQETFEKRRSLICESAGTRQEQAREKYAARGWDLLASITEADRCNPLSSFKEGTRWIGDALCWAVPLDCAGVAVPPALASRPCDALALHTWLLSYERGSAEVQFAILESPVLRYDYTVGDDTLCDAVLLRMDEIERELAWLKEQRKAVREMPMLDAEFHDFALAFQRLRQWRPAGYAAQWPAL